MAMDKQIVDLIKQMDAQGELADFRAWAERQAEGDRRAWERCPAGDWLLWMAAAVGVERASVVRAALGCLAIDRDFIPNGEGLVRGFVEACERWLRGVESLQMIRDTAEDLYAQLTSGASELDRVTANLLDACVWIANLLIEEPMEEDEESGGEVVDPYEAMGAYGRSALMALTKVSAAYACAKTGEGSSSRSWQRAFERAKELCAEMVREVISFNDVQRAAMAVGFSLS